MSTNTRQRFYKPAFGNDNFTASIDNVDIAAFCAPIMQNTDVALASAAPAQTAKASKQA